MLLLFCGPRRRSLSFRDSSNVGRFKDSREGDEADELEFLRFRRAADAIDIGTPDLDPREPLLSTLFAGLNV